MLEHLVKIEYIPIEGTENFSLFFFFKHNEHFTNQVLKKTFYMRDSENPIKSEGTLIEWKENKNITKRI